MAKHLSTLDKLTLSDLTEKDGVILELGDEYCEEDEEEFSYSPDVHLSNAEVMNLLNMDDFVDEDDDKIKEDTSVSLCHVSYDALKSKMTDITDTGKVMKLVKQQGVGDVIPHDAQVTVHYVGFIEVKDEPFDSSFARGGPETFRLCQGMLIPGLEISIASMRKDEIAIFIIHPDLAYGQLGCAPRIPPNEQIMFSVHLIDYLDNGSADTFTNLSVEERRLFPNVMRRAQALLCTAKDSFMKSKTRQAIREYQKAINCLEGTELKNDEEEEEFNKLLSRAYGNLAVCYNKENMPRRACMASNRVCRPTAKTHFNHGRALWRMGEYERAMQVLQIARRMAPTNKEIFNEIRMVNEHQRKYLQLQKSLWSNCLKTKKPEQEEEVLTLFQKAVQDMCKTLSNDPLLLRQPLPDGLTPEEEKYVRAQAAALGLCVTTHERYGKQVTYVNKPNY